MGFKDFVTKKVMERQLKNVPPAQRELIMKLMEKNPELFKKIADEVEAAKKAGQDETMASLTVMRKYQPELQKAAQNL